MNIGRTTKSFLRYLIIVFVISARLLSFYFIISGISFLIQGDIFSCLTAIFFGVIVFGGATLLSRKMGPHLKIFRQEIVFLLKCSKCGWKGLKKGDAERHLDSCPNCSEHLHVENKCESVLPDLPLDNKIWARGYLEDVSKRDDDYMRLLSNLKIGLQKQGYKEVVSGFRHHGRYFDLYGIQSKFRLKGAVMDRPKEFFVLCDGVKRGIDPGILGEIHYYLAETEKEIPKRIAPALSEDMLIVIASKVGFDQQLIDFVCKNGYLLKSGFFRAKVVLADLNRKLVYVSGEKTLFGKLMKRSIARRKSLIEQAFASKSNGRRPVVRR